MSLFIIQHIPTGKIIPCAQGRMDRGGSWVEPVPLEGNLPRVFTAERYAKGWLTSWCKGALTTSYYHDWESGYEEPRTELVERPHRIHSEYKIVPIEIRILT